LPEIDGVCGDRILYCGKSPALAGRRLLGPPHTTYS
jgi:hypothetical protein